MSSGVEAAVVLDAAVIAGLGAARAVGGAAGLAAAGAGALASMAEVRAEERAAALRLAEAYESAIREVLDLNARIAALAESVVRARETYGHAIDIVPPEPLQFDNRPLAELTDWCARTDSVVAVAEERISAALADAVTSRLFSAEAGELRTDLGAVEQSRPVPPAETEREWRTEITETLTRVLGRLLPDAPPADHVRVREAAEQVAAAPTAGEAESALAEVRIRVQQTNARVGERRHGAAAAARFRHELTSASQVAGIALPDAELASVRSALTEVIEGRRVLDDRLRGRVVQLLGTAQAQAEQRYVVDTITAAFTDMGYDVAEGFETLTVKDGDVVLTRGDWPQHVVKVKVEAESQRAAGDTSAPADASAPAQVRLAMVRTEAPVDANDRRLDVEREREWCESFEAARARLAEAGVRTDVRRSIEPGEHPLPIASRRRARQRGAERRRERER